MKNINDTTNKPSTTLTDSELFINRATILQADEQLSGFGGIEYNGYVYEPIEIKAMVDASPSFALPYGTMEEALTASYRMREVGYESFIETFNDGVVVIYSDTLWTYTPPPSKDMPTAAVEIHDINELFF